MSDIYGTNAKPKDIEMPPIQESTPVKQPEEGQIDPVKSPSNENPDIPEQVEAQIEDPKPEVQPEPIKETSQARNFRALREQNEKIVKEKEELAKKLREYEQQQQTQNQRAEKYGMAEEEYDIKVADDELVEGKHISKVAKKIKQLESKLAQYEQQSTLSTVEIKLKSELPDFDKIVTADNIKSLSATYPEIAATLNANPDVYTKAKSAYTLIKNLGIHIEDTYQEDREIVKKNLAKPKPLASVSPQQGDSPLSKANAFANGLTSELKEQLRKEMEVARKGY